MIAQTPGTALRSTRGEFFNVLMGCARRECIYAFRFQLPEQAERINPFSMGCLCYLRFCIRLPILLRSSLMHWVL